MKNKILSISVILTIIICLISAIAFLNQSPAISDDDLKVEQVVALNEISQLAKQAVEEQDTQKSDELQTQILSLQNQIRNSDIAMDSDKNAKIFILISACAIAFVWVIFSYIYFAILGPFDNMKKYAEKIAVGDFDIPLDYERSNYFGEFTWAFDNMRREITKARACEKEAIENNKTVIATLSHDIKTPIASIRAYSEGLEANLDCNADKRSKFLSVIMRKCDEVAKLTNDLFLHSLSDLDKLKITPEKIEICSFLQEIISEISAEQDDVFLQLGEQSAYVNADKNRLTQIVENLINNSRKYAKTKIDITIDSTDENVQIKFRDYGQGINDEDMPFIFDKFYRGKNCKNEQGSGLGLYIVKYITSQMNGNVSLKNHSDGLEVTVSLLRIS